MNSDEYLKKSKHVTIRIIGINERALGLETAEIIKRPLAPLLKRIAERHTHEKTEQAVFTDKAMFHPKEDVTVTKLELWYSNELIAVRRIPEIHMRKVDRLDIEWSLTIKDFSSGLPRDVIISLGEMHT